MLDCLDSGWLNMLFKIFIFRNNLFNLNYKYFTLLSLTISGIINNFDGVFKPIILLVRVAIAS